MAQLELFYVSFIKSLLGPLLESKTDKNFKNELLKMFFRRQNASKKIY